MERLELVVAIGNSEEFGLTWCHLISYKNIVIYTGI